MRNIHIKIKRLFVWLLIAMVGISFIVVSPLEGFADTDEDLTLTLVDDSKTVYVEGEKIFVKATGTQKGAWVGLYKEGDVKDSPANGGSYSFRWYYVADKNGKEVDITDNRLDNDNNRGTIKPGKYEIILFGDEGYTDIQKVIDIEVEKNADIEPAQPSDELSLVLKNESKTNYKRGEAINVRATGIDEGAWVGMYKKGVLKDPDKGGETSYRWFFVADNNGEVVDISNTLYDTNMRGTIEEGDYEIILFGDEGYEQIIKTINITIEGVIDIDESQFGLETDKKEYLYGEEIQVKAEGTGIDNSAWVGLYNIDTEEYDESYLYYYYVKDYEGEFTVIQEKSQGTGVGSNIPNGRYKLVIFADSGYSLPVKSTEIIVTREGFITREIREPGCTTLGLQYVLYKDGTDEYIEIPALGHDWAKPIHISGTTTHKYTCNRNNHETKIESCVHTEIKVLKEASLYEEGIKEYSCSICNDTYTLPISKLKEMPKLKYTSVTYNGNNRKPDVKKIFNIDGESVNGNYYTVTYPSKCKAVGTYNAIVKFRGDYAGTYKLSYKVVPKSINIKKLSKGNNSFKVSWKKATEQTTGYQIKYSTNKTFKNSKYKKVKGIKNTSTSINKLKHKKKYYVKIRAYKVVNDKVYYSTWSNYKSVTTK